MTAPKKETTPVILPNVLGPKSSTQKGKNTANVKKRIVDQIQNTDSTTHLL